MTDYQHNLGKIAELLPVPQWNARKATDDCFSQNLLFRIAEAHRPQQRQNQLWEIGRRGIPGEQPVTWTLQSNHTKRMALDIYPTNCTHEQIAPIFARWGFTHPFPSADPPHYEGLSTVTLLTARLDYYLQSVGRIINPVRKAAVLRAIDRIRKQLGV